MMNGARFADASILSSKRRVMIGNRLGSWVIEKELGRGGMGAVYLGRRAPEAQDSGVAELAAVKVLGPELAAETGFLQRFQREVDALRLLDHPHIVRFYQSGVQDGRYFYAMEYVAGRNFDEILHEKGRLPWKDVVAMALQVCPALKHAHDHGIIHRDLKPQNLMRDESGAVKLADFGVAKVFASRQLTATGGIVGTAEYISPEQASGKPVTPRSDLYSFGVVLYTLLTGRLPFAGDTILDLIHAHRYAQFDAPSKYVTDLPHELDELVCCLMAKDPSDRPANALVLTRAFESIDRKWQRKESLTVVTAQVDTTKADNQDPALPPDEPGPATLMSRLIRRELDAERRGSRLQRFFNHPAVVALLFLLCVSVIGWRFWPDSAETLFARGERLMQSDDPLDWERAEHDYFTPLERKFPDHPHGEAVKEFRERVEASRAERATRSKTGSAPASEAQRFYQRGLRQRAEGNVGAAEQTFQSLITVFDGVPGEAKWVRLARKALAEAQEKIPPATERFKSVHEALERTRTMKREEAARIWDALENLYADDPSAGEIRKQIAALRAEK